MKLETMILAVRLFDVVRKRVKFGAVSLVLASDKEDLIFDFDMNIAGEWYGLRHYVHPAELDHVVSLDACGDEIARRFSAGARAKGEEAVARRRAKEK